MAAMSACARRMVAAGSIGSQRAFLLHDRAVPRSGVRFPLRSHQRWRTQSQDEAQGKEHQSQDRVEGGEKWSNVADGRKDFCLDQIDSELEPDEKFVLSWNPPQVRQNDQQKRENTESVPEVAMRAPKRLPGEEAESNE